MDYSELRLKFDGAEGIETHYGQLMQDIFVLMATGGKRGGTYLEIGAWHSENISNTVLLEREFGWSGVSVEIDPRKAEEFASNRANPCIASDARMIDYAGLGFEEIDYLQVDCEPASVSFEILRKVLASGLQPKIITFEHEMYSEGPEVRDASREYLRSLGYELIVSDIGLEGLPFEDWWVMPAHFVKDVRDALMSVDEPRQEFKHYAFGGIRDAA